MVLGICAEYRLIVFDGTISSETADVLWNNYAHPPGSYNIVESEIKVNIMKKVILVLYLTPFVVSFTQSHLHSKKEY